MTIRTYKPRRGRVTPRQAAALSAATDRLVALDEEPLDLVALFDGRPVILDIGFGTGAATAQMAQDDPGSGILAVDVHTPGIGDLLGLVDELGLVNVRVIEGDALTVLRTMIGPASLDGVRTFFPDPWPKARHHKRRLVTADNATLIASRTRVGGWWHLATDWEPYADWIREVLDAHPMWTGGVIPRPQWRPVTRYEATGLRHDRTVTDLRYTRVESTN